MASALPDVTKSQDDPRPENKFQTENKIGPDVEWEEENISIEKATATERLPCIGWFEEIQNQDEDEAQHLSSGLKIYTRQPVLFYARSQRKQTKARTIYRDKQGTYFEIGQTLLLPDDYQGWFEIVPSDFSRSSCFVTIDDVAKVMPKKFFTRSNIKAIHIEGEGTDQKYLEKKVKAGSVLSTLGTFTAKWKTQAVTGTFKKKTKEWEFQEVTYLKCQDTENVEILIPFTTKGKFNAIYERGQLTQNAVYSMKDILTDLSLPLKVRLLFGKAPVVPCIFTGMLVIRETALVETVTCSTILNKRNVLFEIPLNSPVIANYTRDDQMFAEMETYKDARKLCKRYASLFSSMIKLSPDMDTNQKIILHVPSDPSLLKEADESLRALDLITDISFSTEPKDHLLDSSDNGSMSSNDQLVLPKTGELTEWSEFKTRESQTHV